MKKIIRLTIVFFISIASLTYINAQKYVKKIQDKGELKVGMTLKQPPFCMKDKKGLPIGYEVELAETLAESMDVKLSIVEIPFPGLMKALEDGTVDIVMSGMTITTQRNMKAVFVGPHFISGKSILTHSPSFSNTDEPQDLNRNNVKIVVLKGSTSETFVKKEIPEAELILKQDYDECIKMLEEKKAQIMVADYPICAYTVQLQPEKKLITLDKPLTIEPIGIALPKDASHFINLVENYLNILLLTGELEELQSYWFDSGEWVEQVVKKKPNIY